MRKYKTIPIKKFIEAYQRKACNLSQASRAIGVSRFTVYQWRKENPELDRAMRDCEEELLDNTESILMKKIQEGDTTAVIFYLKTKGRNRGYIERVENNVQVNAFEELMKALPDKGKE